MSKSTKTKQTENTRVSGAAVWTPLSQLPDRFTHGPHTIRMSEYTARRWYAHSYGWFKRVKGIEYNQEWTPEQRKHERYRWIEHPTKGLRFIGKVHEIRMSGDGNLPYIDGRQIDHNGWFVDNYQDETVCGEVYQLPARDGRNQYVPAIEDHNGNDGAILDFHSVTDDIRQAIRNADSMAEWYAEDEREYQARESAKCRIEEIEAEVKESYQAFKRLVKEIRTNCDKLTGLTEVQALIREHWRDVRREIEGLRREKRKLEDNFWSVAPDY